VDDAAEAREMYGLYLVHVGLRVEHAGDGDHALWKVVWLKPDLVVMDLAMPVLDGWEATYEMKTHARTKHIPVIALTGRVLPDDLQRAHDAGADAVLTKPCTPEALFVVVRQLLAR
jgi:CheY-like chemotaxis protein